MKIIGGWHIHNCNKLVTNARKEIRMKKRYQSTILLALTGVLLIGCGRMEVQKTEQKENQAAAQEKNTQADISGTQDETMQKIEETRVEKRRMVMLDNKLYVETGETSCTPRCGMRDFHFNSSVKEGVPTKNYQTNFGKGYSGQFGTRDNRIEIFLDEAWHVFAYNENDFDGVAMRVLSNTNHSLEFAIHSETDANVQFGDSYLLEVFDEESDTWVSVYPKNMRYHEENVAFHDIAYIVEKGKTNIVTEDWTLVYGNLDAGKYRIVKEIMDFRGTGDYITHTLTAEFEI